MLRTAIALADAEGIDVLSMRRLGHELRVEAMAVYHYFGDKNELLAGMLDLIHSEVEAPSGTRDWKADVRKSALSYHDALTRHPWASAVITSPATMSAARLQYIDALLKRLREAGFNADMTYHAYHALDSHITGATLWEAGYRSWKVRVDAAEVRQRALRLAPPDEHPHFAEHLEQHRTSSAQGDKTDFEFVLDLILDGLDRLRRRRS